MKILSSVLIILTAFTVTFSQNLYDSNTYTDLRYDFSITGIDAWSMEYLTNNYRVIFYPADKINEVYVAVTAYISSEITSAGVVQQIRAGTNWDRMKILGLKKGDDKITALYENSEIDEDQNLQNQYVAEDIYVKDYYKVYVVTAVAKGEDWLLYKDKLREIMKSFYIGRKGYYE